MLEVQRLIRNRWVTVAFVTSVADYQAYISGESGTFRLKGV